MQCPEPDVRDWATAVSRDSRVRAWGREEFQPWVEPRTNAVRYYNESRTHLSLGKGAPDGRPVEQPSAGPIGSRPEVGGLHHRYHREAA